jgi:hypothetical protein
VQEDTMPLPDPRTLTVITYRPDCWVCPEDRNLLVAGYTVHTDGSATCTDRGQAYRIDASGVLYRGDKRVGFNATAR